MPWRQMVLVFGVVLALYALTMSGHLYSPDGELMFRTTQSMVERRSLAVEPIAGFATRSGRNGLEYAQYGLGQPIAAVPFYLFGKILAAVAPPATEFWRGQEIVFAEAYHGERLAESGSYWLRFGVSLFNQVCGAALAMVVFLLALELAGDLNAARRTAWLFAFATMAWPHNKAFFSETLAVLCVALSFLFLLYAAKAHRLSFYAWSGACAGYAVLTRMDSQLLLSGVFLFALWINREQPCERVLRRAAAFCAPLAGFAMLIMLVNASLYGSPLASGYSDQQEGVKFVTPLTIGLYGLLFSYGKGLFFFSPALILFFFGINGMLKTDKKFAVSLLVSCGVFLLVMAKWQNWGGGWCWGPRHIFQLNALLILPVAVLLKDWERASVRALFWAALLISGAVQLYGCSQSPIDFYWHCFRRPQTETAMRLQYSPAEDEALLLRDYVLLKRSVAQEDDETTGPAFRYWRDAKNLDSLKSELSLERFAAEPDAQMLRAMPPEMRRQALARIEQRRAAGLSKPGLPPPLSHSFWIPEHTVWSGYAALRREIGRHDFFWLHVLGLKSGGK